MRVLFFVNEKKQTTSVFAWNQSICNDMFCKQIHPHIRVPERPRRANPKEKQVASRPYKPSCRLSVSRKWKGQPRNSKGLYSESSPAAAQDQHSPLAAPDQLTLAAQYLYSFASQGEVLLAPMELVHMDQLIFVSLTLAPVPLDPLDHIFPVHLFFMIWTSSYWPPNYRDKSILKSPVIWRKDFVPCFWHKEVDVCKFCQCFTAKNDIIFLGFN